MLIENDANITYKDVTVAGHKASCIDYNVARSPVSVHLPLNRIIAGLLVETHKVGEPLDFLVHCSDSVTLVSVVYHVSSSYWVLRVHGISCDFLQPIPGNVPLLMEDSVRCLVLVAQSQAGMWKRNGYSLLNQVTAAANQASYQF